MNLLPKAFLAVALALCLLMPSTQSLWMDEAQTWRLASLPTVSALFYELWKTYA